MDRATTVLTAPEEEGVKKFLVTSMYIDYTAGLVFLGSRNGAVAVYTLSGALRGCWQGVHGGDAVTEIMAWPGVGVLTAGRNGGWCGIKFDAGKMTIVHSVKLVGSIEGGAGSGDELVLYGFRGKSFFVWDEKRGCEVAAVECGGAHRAWGFYWPEGEGEGWFVWTKASKVRHGSSLGLWS